MSNFYLEFSIDGMFLARKTFQPLVDGSREFIHARFDFSADWEGADKFLLVARNNETETILLQNDEAVISYEAVRTAGKFDMQVLGIRGSVRITTNPVTIVVGSSEMANNPSGEESRLSNDFLASALEGTKENADNAKISEINASTSATRADQAKHMAAAEAANAKEDADRSRTAAEEAATSASAANTSSIQANTFANQASASATEARAAAEDAEWSRTHALKGKDGKSVTVSAIPNGVKVADGFGNEVEIHDGKDGADGKDGKDGEIPADKLAQIDQNTQALNDELLQIQRLTDKQEAMWKLMNNINYEWKETDNNAYSVSVPLGAKECILQGIESKTVNVNQIFNLRVAGSNATVETVGTKVKFIKTVAETRNMMSFIAGKEWAKDHKYYVAFNSINDDNTDKLTYINIYMYDSWNSLGSVSNLRYEKNVSCIISSSDNSFKGTPRLTFTTYYSSEVGVGSYCEIENVMIIDLTEYCGEGNEYDLETCKRVFDYVPYTPTPIPTEIKCDKLILNGKNIFHKELVQGGFGSNGAYYPSNSRCRTNEFISVKKGYYTVSVSDGALYELHLFNANQVQTREIAWKDSGVSFGVNEGETFIKLAFRKADNTNCIPTDFKQIQIEQGTQATDFSPYSVTEIPLADKTIPFSFEVEGNGTIDFHNSAETKDNIQSNTKYFIALNEVK